MDGEETSLAELETECPSSTDIDINDELQRQLAKVSTAVGEILIADQSFPELDRLSIRAAKVLVPGMMPVTFGHQYRRINMTRLTQVAKSHGWATTGLCLTDLNSVPHNFP